MSNKLNLTISIVGILSKNAVESLAFLIYRARTIQKLGLSGKTSQYQSIIMLTHILTDSFSGPTLENLRFGLFHLKKFNIFT